MKHVGDYIFAEVLARVRVVLVLDQVLTELFPIKYVYAHGGEIAFGLFGLFLELLDIAVGAEVHDAEARGLLHGDLQNGYRAGRVSFNVLAQHFRVVHLIDVVARKDEDIIGIIHLDKADILINGVCRSGKPGARLPRSLIRRKDEHAAVGGVEIPGLAAAYIAVELERTVLREHAHRVYTRICAVRQREVYYAVFPAEGHVGLSHVLGQCVKPRALTSRKEHCYAAFLHVVRPF